jgi:hypothetical protein
VASANESGDDRSGGAAARGARLLDRGLERYGAGDLVGAIADWEQALLLDPGLDRAREYVDYVRANFEELEAQFAAAREAAEAASRQGVPLGEEGPADLDSYDSLDVEVSAVSDAGLEELDVGLAQLDAGLAQVLQEEEERAAPADEDDDEPALEIEAMAPDEDVAGLAPDLEGEPASDDEATIDVRVLPALRRPIDLEVMEDFDDLPPPGTRPHVMTIQPRQTGETPAVTPAAELEMPAIELEGLLDGADARSTLRSAMPPVRVSPAPPVAPPIGDEEEATRAFDRRGGILVTPRRPGGPVQDLASREPRPPAHDDFNESEFTAEYEDTRKTREHNPFAAGGPPARQAAPPEQGDSSVIIDERLLETTGLGREPARDPELTGDFRPRRDPSREAREDRIRRRVTELLKSAEESAGRGEFLAAVASVEEVMREDDEGVIAPVLLHRHRDLLYRIYEGHIGDMQAVPLVAVPLHEIAGQALDHRTGFLLSRIDGMLSFEDILDVAGMPRMEAYQILSNLLRKGVIEVR